jgi:serine protease AprX
MTKLEEAGAEYLNYVSENTYLCRYQKSMEDQIPISKLEFVVYCADFGDEFKISPGLKEARDEAPDKKYEVDITLHKGLDLELIEVLEDLQDTIKAESSCDESVIDFRHNKTRLNIPGCNLDKVASIIDVYRVEDVPRLATANRVAREILKVNGNLPSTSQSYTGIGQVIAIADTGLDGGEQCLLHPAFQGRVRCWFSEFGTTVDTNGHSTHVCGSAVGGGNINTDGTASQAELVVQSIYNDKEKCLSAPRNLSRLFDHAYAEGARVHSNSWNTRSEPFQQLDYTSHAEEIDKFVYEHPEMIVCWAAGNDHIPTASDGEIGAEAAAKNCITVGASESALNSDQVADFSSRGPLITPMNAR